VHRAAELETRLREAMDVRTKAETPNLLSVPT
jgi:hypothetical protein